MTEEDDIQGVLSEIARRQTYRKAPRRMADVVNALIARRGYAQVRSKSELDQAWRELVGSRLAGHCVVGNLRRGMLEVIVDSSAALQELTFQKQRLLARLKDLPAGRRIRGLRFRVGSLG